MMDSAARGAAGPFRRYIQAGVLVFGVGMAQYALIHRLLPPGRWHAGGAWAVHFLLGTLWTHALHRRYTFARLHQVPYLPSLARTGAAYAGLGGLSTALMILLCDVGGCHHLAGFVLTSAIVGFLNYLVMRRFAIVD